MKFYKKIGCGILTASTMFVSMDASAQYYNPQQDRYGYCQEQASRMSGYYGESPDRYRQGNALRKAAKQARQAEGLAFLLGADKKERRKIRKKAAANGFLKGAIQRGIQEDRQRKSRERYDYEFRTCMSSR